MKNAIHRALDYAVLILIVAAAVGSTSLLLSFNKRLLGASEIQALIVEWDQVMTGSIKK
jgi:hypothetical protein